MGSDMLPNGDKEKQMLRGLLGSKERMVKEMWAGWAVYERLERSHYDPNTI